MYKIGILGSDNSHALAFSKLVNIPDPATGEYLYPDIRITGIYGHDSEQTEKVATEGQLDFIAEKPEDFSGKVDAVMVVFRHGDLHAKYALPFIRAGIPTWIDKPFAISISDAIDMIETAETHETLLTGGSTCKYAYDVLMLKNTVESNSIGNIITGSMNFPADLESEYGGLFFYGPHLAEMVMTVFGYDVRSVAAYVKNGSITALARYDRYDITMNFTRNSRQYVGIVYGENRTAVREIDISIVYRLGFDKFAKMLRTGKLPMPLQHLLAPTVLLNGIMKSLETGREVSLDELL